jgi:hypothetical protein
MDSSGIFPASISAVLKSQDTFGTLLFDCLRFEEDGVCDANSAIHTAVINADSGRNEGRQCGRESNGSAGWSRCPAIRYPTSRPFSAYEREASAASTLHDNGLQVLQAKRHDDGTDKFLCEVTFISKGEPERPYRHRRRCPGRRWLGTQERPVQALMPPLACLHLLRSVASRWPQQS